MRLGCALLLAGCAAGTGGGAGPAASPGTPGDPAAGGTAASGGRDVAPFVVLDENGVPYAFPFLGGFNVPRPQFVDIDGDDDLDLFVQERSGALMFFENRGGAAVGPFVWRTDRYQGLDVGEWSRFVDLDGDGDLDLLAEQRYSYIRYYRNDGTPRRAEFVLATDSVRDVEGAAVFADRQNIPNLTDIDCDGRLDLFLGRVDGTVRRYELADPGPDGLPRFRFVTDRFEGILIIGQIIPSARHGANSMEFADVDADGDQDLFWGDYFEPGVLFIENTGSCVAPSMRGEPVQVPAASADSLRTSGYNVPVLTDPDADGDLDLFLGVLGGAFNPTRTAADNFYFFERVESGALRLRTRRFLTSIDVGSESIPAFADTDGDGDLDLYLANKIDPVALNSGRVYRFENTGSATSPRFALRDTLALREAYHLAPAFADLDGDDDLDLLLGSWNKGIAFFRNDGTASEPRWVLADSAFITLTRGSHTTPATGDLDGDGDLDLIVGEAGGTLNYYRNDGSAHEPRFTLVSDEYLDIDAGRRSFPALADLDGDGDLDLVVGSEAGDIVLYRNEGDVHAPRFVKDESATLPNVPYAAPAFVDLNADGRLELVVGGLAGGVEYWP
ncbi:MAG TPA: VCBS repeat-containing protein [Longimicrobiales bacterium]